MSPKNFILDTNVLLLDYQSIFKFEENTVIIPMIVLEELDNHKEGRTQKAFNARQVQRYLDKLCKRGKLTEGVKLNNGGMLYVAEAPNAGDFPKNDDKIVGHASFTSLHCPEEETVLVSNDCNVRLKARALGLEAQGYEPSESRVIDKEFKGYIELTAEELAEGLPPLFDNQYVKTGDTLCRFNKASGELRNIKYPKDLPVSARNDGQKFVLDALLDPTIKLVTITGKAGTGKTLLATGAGLSQVLCNEYRKLTVARPVMPMGNDLGFLPGTKEEKLLPWIQPIFDNIEFMLGDKPNTKGTYSVDSMMEDGTLELEALAYIRGRTFHKQFLIIDEAQNLSSHEIKTIITRAGEDTKIILTGDIEQIDSPHLDEHNNGLSLVVDKVKDYAISAHIHLEESERSELAGLAADIL